MKTRAVKVERTWKTKAGLRAVCVLAHDNHRCGYVEVPKGHPLYGVDKDEEPVDDFHVHRSVTFSGDGGGTYPLKSDGWWFGFDCMKDGGMNPEFLRELEMNFITGEGRGDVKTMEFVSKECESLARQIADITKEIV